MNQRLRADLQTITDLIEVKSKVLDLGCGDGALLADLVQNKQVQGRGVELSETGVLACVRRGLSVRQGNLEEGLADYPDDSFDYIILSQTLPYLDDPAMILREMLRVGQTGIVSFPNWAYWRHRLRFLWAGRAPNNQIYLRQWQTHQRWQLFTIADFVDYCREAEVAIVQERFLAGEQLFQTQRWANVRAETAVFLLQRQNQ